MKHIILILSVIFCACHLQAQLIHIPINSYTKCDYNVVTSECKNPETYKPLLDGMFMENNHIAVFLHDKSSLSIKIDRYEVEGDLRKIYGIDRAGDELIVYWEKGATSYYVRWNDRKGDWGLLVEFSLKGQVDDYLFTDPYYKHSHIPHVFKASKVIVNANGDKQMFPSPERYIKVKEIGNEQYVVGHSDNPDILFRNVTVKYSGVEGKEGAFLYNIDGYNETFEGLTFLTTSEKLSDMAIGKTGQILFFTDKKNFVIYETSQTDSVLETATPDNYSYTKYEAGFDPFIAKLNSDAEFKTTPSDSASAFKLLLQGAQIYVFSKEAINDYYKVIDIASSDIGWIHKETLNYIQDVEFGESGAFQSTGYSAGFDSQVLIQNKSTYLIKLVVGDTVFSLMPNSSKTVQIKPENKYYIATAPGVMPASGYQEFKPNNSYEWEFWVSTISN